MINEPLARLGFSLLSGEPGVMPAFHRHTEIEVNLVAAGEMRYLFGGSRLMLPPGQIAVFWAALPHRVTQLAAGTQYYCFHVPLSLFLQWHLPSEFTSRLLRGEMVREFDSERAARDLPQFERWRTDLTDSSPEALRIVHLELEARLRRLAQRTLAQGTPSLPHGPADTQAGGKVEQMAGYIGEHYQEAITMTDIAAAVDLHPKYAMSLFRAHCGMTVGDYLTQQRLSQAQRLLATTDAKVIDIAFAAGFGSVSRFYEVFERDCGQTPKAYRAGLAL